MPCPDLRNVGIAILNDEKKDHIHPIAWDNSIQERNRLIKECGCEFLIETYSVCLK